MAEKECKITSTQGRHTQSLHLLYSCFLRKNLSSMYRVFAYKCSPVHVLHWFSLSRERMRALLSIWPNLCFSGVETFIFICTEERMSEGFFFFFFKRVMEWVNKIFSSFIWTTKLIPLWRDGSYVSNYNI